MDLSRDEAAVMLAALACRADGHHDEQESALIRKRLAAPLKRLGHDAEARSIEHLYRLLETKGLPGALQSLQDALPQREDRIAAMRLAGEIVQADGSVTREEMEHLARVGKKLGVSKADLGL